MELVDVEELREEVRKKYREVADTPTADFHFHTGRDHALRMGYPRRPSTNCQRKQPEFREGVIEDLPIESD